MKDASATSPFAALSSKEQMERWACWHGQRMDTKPTCDDLESESVCDESKPTLSHMTFKPHHSQYDAVVRRMRKASQQAMSYSSCTSG